MFIRSDAAPLIEDETGTPVPSSVVEVDGKVYEVPFEPVPAPGDMAGLRLTSEGWRSRRTGGLAPVHVASAAGAAATTASDTAR